jgi:hypothetical protein
MRRTAPASHAEEQKPSGSVESRVTLEEGEQTHASPRTSNGVAAATALFRTEGLELPFVPTEFARRFRERGPWCFASRQVRVGPYAFEHYVDEADAASDYVLIAHAGHGVNSYALHYYLVRKPFQLFLQG